MNGAVFLVLLAWVAPGKAGAERASHSQRMSSALRSAAEADWEAALAAVAPTLEGEGFSERERAEAHFARGWIQALRLEAEPPSEDPDPSAASAARRGAAEDFEKARVLAGPGALRRAAVYDLGWVDLTDAEAWRSRIPELGGGPPSTLPGGPGPGTGGQQTAPDPLTEARSAYHRARERFLERLRLDWRDRDTRANLELIQRRLRELRDLERERQQANEDQPDSNDSDSKPSPDGESSEDSDSQAGKDDPSGESRPPEGEGEGQPPSPSDEQAPPQEEEPPEPPAGAESPDSRDPEASAAKPHEGEPQERHLTREEVMRLLDRLSRMEEQYRAFQEALRAARRIPVERDW